MLKLENTVLRAPRDSDMEVLLAMRNDVELQLQLAARPRPNSEERVREWIHKHSSDPNTLFYIVAEEAGAACGYIQLTEMDSIDGTGRLGVCIARAAQSTGHATRAIALLEDYAHAILGLRKIVLSVLSSNSGAIKLYRKIGYLDVGVHREHHYARGAYHDMLVMEKLL